MYGVCHTNIPLIKDISKRMYMFIIYLYTYITRYWMYTCIKNVRMHEKVAQGPHH